MSTNQLSSYDRSMDAEIVISCLRSWWSFARRKAGWNILSYVSVLRELENRMNMDENETLNQKVLKKLFISSTPQV